MRRALILALGTYGTEGLSPGEREPLIGKLLDLYRNDPDAGIHGAAEWTLRKWKQQDKLKERDAELMKIKRLGRAAMVCERPGTDLRRDRRTGRVPHGVAADRDGTQSRKRRLCTPHACIPRRFAIAAKEVTVEQFQRFLKRDRITIDATRLPPSFVQQYSPDPDGPWIAPDWYIAGSLLQLAERAGGFAQRPVVLPPQRGRRLRRGDDDPCRRSRAQGLSPAHRGGMGIRLPGRCGHQPILRSLDRLA